MRLKPTFFYNRILVGYVCANGKNSNFTVGMFFCPISEQAEEMGINPVSACRVESVVKPTLVGFEI